MVYTPAVAPLTEGQRTEAIEAAVTFCGTPTVQTRPAFLPKFTNTKMIRNKQMMK